MTAKVIDKDKGLKALRKRLLGSDVAVKVGVLEDAGQHDGATESGDPMTVAEVAITNEFGTDRIPARPAQGLSVDDHRAEIGREMRRVAGAIADGVSPELAIGQLGAQHQARMRESYVDLDDPPNAPMTIARKGSSNPLVDTGQLVQSLTWELVVGKARIAALRAQARGS